MRVLVMGASGLIGSALARKLLARGHQVILGVRDDDRLRAQWLRAGGAHDRRINPEIVRADFTDARTAAQWPSLLAGTDAVVNTVGIFRERGSQTFDALHVEGPRAMFEAAVAAGARIVQFSALGARPDASTGYLVSKGRADAALRALPGSHTIVQPSLVFSPQGPSTRGFAMLAALPVTPLPAGGAQCIQPVHLDDLCEATVRLLESPAPPPQLLAVGVEPVSLRDYLAYFKRALGLGGTFLAFPAAWSRAAARLLRHVPGSLVTPDALSMLDAGSVADAQPLRQVLGHAPRNLDEFIGPPERDAMRRRAQLAWIVPLLRWAVAIMWVVTGLVSAFVFPLDSSLALLARTGLTGGTALFALHAAAALDVALGLTTLARRTRRWSYRAQLSLIGFYTVIISIFLPEYWAHPYGPILKNIPLLAAIAALHELDDGDGDPGR